MIIDLSRTHAGARIEMEKDELKLVNTLMSHPTQVRSLK
jgi:DNA-binding response OmpR family regulator